MELEFHQLEQRYETLRVRNPQRERSLFISLEANGQQQPILVVRHDEAPDRYVVIDGYKRLRALSRLKQDTVQATLLDLSEAEALVLERSLRNAAGDSALEQGWLLAQLRRSEGWSQEELARRFDRSPTWVSRRLAMVQELPASVQDRIRRGQIPAQAAMKSLIPMARVDCQACERLGEAIAEQQLRSREIRRIAMTLQISCTLVKRVIFTRTPDPCRTPRRATR